MSYLAIWSQPWEARESSGKLRESSGKLWESSGKLWEELSAAIWNIWIHLELCSPRASQELQSSQKLPGASDPNDAIA